VADPRAVDFQPDPKIGAILAGVDGVSFSGRVWKHTMPGQPPNAANTLGARWNPRGVPARYYALTRETALAEGNHLAGLQPQPIRGTRHLHELSIRLERVLDLRDPAVLRRLGLSDAELRSNDHTACRLVGGTAESLGFDGMLVPSARGSGANLVVFERRISPSFEAVELAQEPVGDSPGRVASAPGQPTDGRHQA